MKNGIFMLSFALISALWAAEEVTLSEVVVIGSDNNQSADAKYGGYSRVDRDYIDSMPANGGVLPRY